MKKIILLLAAAILSATFVFAQREAKPGILPEKGDFSIGVNAAPFLNFGGNLFNENGNMAPWFEGVTGNIPGNVVPGSFGPTTGLLIYGKYFLEDNKAVRAKFRFGLGSDSNKASIGDQANAGKMVEDKMSSFSADIELGLGMEYRRGYGRIQAFWGYEASLGVISARDKYTYGNKMDATYTDPWSYDWTANAPANLDERTTKQSYGTAFMLRPAAFVGVEYFFAKKMSVGGEFNAGLMIYTKGKGKTETEYWDGSAVKTQKNDYRNPDDTASRFGLTTSTYGALNLNFYF